MSIGETVTMDDLNTFGIDSVKIISTHETNGSGEPIYKIVFTQTYYEDFTTFVAE